MKGRNIRRINLPKIKKYTPVKNARINNRTQSNRFICDPHFTMPINKPIYPAIGAPRDTNKRIALVFHSFYKDKTLSLLDSLIKLKSKFDFDFYMSICSTGTSNDADLIKRFREALNAKIYIFPNVGKDIVPKLRILRSLCKSDIAYDYVFLHHDKKSKQYLKDPRNKWMHSWHDELLLPLLNDKFRNAALAKFQVDDLVGAIGTAKHLHYGPGWTNGMSTRRCFNETDLLQKQALIERRLKLPPLNQSWFIGGTMFWLRYDIIKNFILNNDIDYFFNITREDIGNVQDPSYTHCLERFFGHIIKLSNYKLIGLE